ncbi:RH-like protein isoform X3 [Kogia breviceps]
MRTYRDFQDVIIMAILGLGFLNTSLRRHCWSSVAFNLFMLALGVQLTVLVDGFLNQLSLRKMVLNLSSIQISTMSATSVLISVGVILGKVNLLQLLLMTLIEVTAFSATRMVGKEVFNMDNHVSMMYIHVFAACFGLTVACCLPKPLPNAAEDKDQTATSPSLFSMLGTLFLWMFWPSFNSALLDVPDEKKKALFNTYYALAVSMVTAISVSALAHPQGKINMVCLQRMLDLHDTYGVQYTFGLPGLLGGLTNIVLMALQVKWTKISMLGYQILTDSGAFSFTIIMGVGSGLLTGLLLNLKIWKSPHVVNYFNDQTFWKFPHLAVGY